MDIKSTNRANIIPTIKYKDASNAIDWLCKTFGFEKHLLVPGENGTIAHAQLTFENGMIMLGSAGTSEFDQYQKPPGEVGGIGTQSAYIIVDRIDDHYETAKQNGAEITIKIRDEDHGGRSYSCKDPEGHLWNFGSYDPWA